MTTAAQVSPQPLRKGLTSDVFAFGDDRVLKLLHPRYSRAKAESEFRITGMLHGAGLPVPRAHEVVEQDSRFGIVFERVLGLSLLQVVERKPWKLFYAAKMLAELHAQVHGFTAPSEMPTQRAQLQNWLANANDFTPRERQAAQDSLALVPDGHAVCHGDMHPANILLSDRGPIIIDWSAATRGDSGVDVARTSVLFESAKLPPDSAWHTHLLLALARRLLHRTYLARYFKLRGGRPEQVRKYLPIQRAGRSAWRATQLASD